MQKPLEFPLAIAKAFVRDMRTFHAEENSIKRDEIASRQLHALIAFQRPQDKRLRLADVKQMFLQLKDHA
jgi:septin family protein